MAAALPTGVVYASDGTPLNLIQEICDTTDQGQRSVSTVVGVGLAFPAIAILAVALRFVTVRIQKRATAIYDWLVVLGLLPSIAVCFLVVAAEYAQDRRVKSELEGVDDPVIRCLTALEDQTTPGWPAQYSVSQGTGLDIALIAAILHLTAVTFVKISILSFYGKIFATPSMKIIVRFGCIFLLCYWIAFFIPNAVYIQQTMDPDFSQWLAVSWSVLLLVAGVLNLATDVILLVLPTFYIAGLQISRAKKLQCIGIFGVGTVVVIASIARLVYLVQYWQSAFDQASRNVDSLDWDSNPQHAIDFYAAIPIDRAVVLSRNMMLWTFIEPCTSVLAACLPTYRPLVEKVSQTVSSWTRSRSFKSLGIDAENTEGYPGRGVNQVARKKGPQIDAVELGNVAPGYR